MSIQEIQECSTVPTMADLQTPLIQVIWARRRVAVCFFASLIAIVALGVSPASARGATGGARIGRPMSVMSLPHHGRFSAHAHFGHFHDFRSHHRDHGEFASWFWPWGFAGDFGWPWPQYAPAEITADESDRGRLPLARRYEPPTVETTPSGVTIMRGPGSRHF